MLRRGFLITITAVLIAAPAVSQQGPVRRKPRTRSHRTRPRPPAPKPIAPPKPLVPAEPSAEIQARPELLRRPLPKERRLSRGRWNPLVADALERILEYTGENDPAYTPANPPVAVFTLDDGLVNGDLGQALFNRLTRRAEFKFIPAFWALIPQQYGRARIEAGYRGFQGTPPASWPNDPYYRMYRKGMLRAYRSICETAGRPACGRWIASLLIGFEERELRRYAQETLIEELDRPVGFDDIGDTPEDPKPEPERRGIRMIPEMLELLQALRGQGIDVWVLSDTNDWAAKVFAGAYGVHPSRVVGMRVKVSDEMITGESLIPTPLGSGAAEAVTMFIGRSPVLTVSSEENEELLAWGRGVRVVLTRSPPDRKTESRWRGRGWLLQPAFSAVRAPQRLPGSAQPESGETP